jgi:hypothetical protein
VHVGKQQSISGLGPRLDALKKWKFFHSLFITSIFGPMHEVVNIDKKITNYTV